MTQHTPSIEDRFAAYQDTEAPADLRRRLVAAIKTIDPVSQLDATGCVLAGVLMEEYRLREINAELLAALKETEAFFAARAEQISAHVGSGFKPLRRRTRAAITRAEGEDR